MFNSICSKRGISLVEAMVAVLLVSTAIVALLSLFPASWRLAGTSDSLGKASALLAQQLQIQQNRIANPNNLIDGAPRTDTLFPSGQTVAQPGDTPFTVNTRFTDLGGGNFWQVTVNVTWPGNPTGISESLRVLRQENYRQ